MDTISERHMDFGGERDPAVWARYLVAIGFETEVPLSAKQADGLEAFLGWALRVARRLEAEPPAEVVEAISEALLRLSPNRLCLACCARLEPSDAMGRRCCPACGVQVRIDDPVTLPAA